VVQEGQRKRVNLQKVPYMLAVICGANACPSFAPSVQNCSDCLYRPDAPRDRGEQRMAYGQIRRAPKHRALRKITEIRNQLR
jgi:hypothetical protein